MGIGEDISESAYMRVGFIGECMAELKELDGQLSEGFAGDTYNSAVYLKRTFNQHETFYISSVGSDPLSDQMVAGVEEENISTRFLKRDTEKHIGLYRIYTDDEGERSFIYWRSDSAAKRMMSMFDATDIASMTALDMVLFSGIALAILNEDDLAQYWMLLSKLKASGTKLVFDMNHRPSLWRDNEAAKALYAKAFELADVVLPGLEDFNFLYGFETIDEVISYLEQFTFDEIIIKNGSDPVTVIAEGNRMTIPLTPATKVVDTTSAGDAFNGVYLGARLAGVEIEDAVQKASKCAAFVIQHRGAIVEAGTYQDFVQNLA